MYSNILFASILLLLCITGGFGQDKPMCSPYMDNCECSDDEVLATITCTKGGGCVSSDQTKYPVPDDGSQPRELISYVTMTAEVCKTACTANSEDPKECFYYKFTSFNNKKYCHFMSVEQCLDDGEIQRCGEDANICISGPSKEDSCEPYDGGSDEPPPTFTCTKVASPHKPGMMPDYVLHWKCLDGNFHDIDIYKIDAPGNTVCTATPSCGEKEIKYTCVENSGSDGKWEKSGDTDSTDDNGDLIDPTCNAKDLKIKGYKEQEGKGMDIQCIAEGKGGGVVSADGDIQAQNSCLMLCDGLPVLHFYTVKDSWKFVRMNDEEAEEQALPDETTNDNIIYCWSA